MSNVKVDLDKLIQEAIKLYPLALKLSTPHMFYWSDINDYLLFRTLDGLENEKIAREFIEEIRNVGYSLKETEKIFLKDFFNNLSYILALYFYRGMLFALSELLSLKWKIKIYPFEDDKCFDRKVWLKSFKKTLKELGLI